MIRYFISYNELDKKTVSREKINILRRNKDKSYSAISLEKLDESIVENLHKINDYKKNIFIMVEIDEKNIDKYNSLLIKEFSEKNGKLIFNKKDLSLMNYTNYINLNEVLDKKNFIELFEDENEITLINVEDENEYFENRYLTIKRSVLSDIYVNIEDKNIIEKNKNDITLLTQRDIDKYEIKEHKIFVIDSIPENIASGFWYDSKKIFYYICNNSIPAYIEEIEDEKYNIKLKGNCYDKKVYLMKNFDIKSVIYDTALTNLLKYINLYIYESGYYKKMNLEEYLRKENILKYIKKPS